MGQQEVKGYPHTSYNGDQCEAPHCCRLWGLGADVKGANRRARNDQLNRALQNVLFATLGEANELAAKKALGLLTELWRRQLWRDARTANVIGEHP